MTYVAAWVRLWFSQNDTRTERSRLRVRASFRGETIEEHVSKDGSIRASEMGRLIGKNWLT